MPMCSAGVSDSRPGAAVFSLTKGAPMNIARSVVDLVGRTPLVRLNRVCAGVAPQIVAKLESANPGNSVKDRIGLAMIEAAERSGELVPGESVIV